MWLVIILKVTKNPGLHPLSIEDTFLEKTQGGSNWPPPSRLRVNRPKNNYETVGNIKVVFIDSYKQLEVQIKSNKVKLSCLYFVNMASGCTHEDAAFVFRQNFYFIVQKKWFRRRN